MSKTNNKNKVRKGDYGYIAAEKKKRILTALPQNQNQIHASVITRQKKVYWNNSIYKKLTLFLEGELFIN